METPQEYKKIGIEVGQGKYHEEMVYGIGLVYVSMINEIGAYLKKYDLTPTDMNILMMVKHQGADVGISQVDVGQKLMVTAHNVTRTIQRLEKKELVSRVNHSKDTRVKLVTITAKGSQLLDQVWPGYDKQLESVANNISIEEQKSLSELLQKWLNNKKR